MTPSDWSDKPVYSADGTEAQSRTAYHYYYFVCSNCGAHMHGSGMGYSWAGGCGKNTVSSNSYKSFRDPLSYNNTSDFHGTGANYSDKTSHGRAFAYTSTNSGYYIAPITQYRSRDREMIRIYHFSKTEYSESYIYPSGSDINNIQEWAKYQPK